MSSAIKVAVTVALLLVLFASVDTGEFLVQFRRAHAGLLALAAGAYASTFVIGALRWRVIGRTMGILLTVPFAVRNYFISGFFSQFVPGGGYGGDVYRVWITGRQTGDGQNALLSVVVDRMSGFLGALLVIAALFPAYWTLYRANAAIQYTVAASALVLVTIVVVSWALRKRLATGLEAKLNARGPVASRLLAVARAVSDALSTWPQTPVHLGWSIAALAANLIALAAISNALHVDAGLDVYLLLGPIIFLAKSFPLSVSGWGAREAAAVYFFGFAGIKPENALAIALLSGALTVVASLPGAMLWLLSVRNADRAPGGFGR